MIWKSIKIGVVTVLGAALVGGVLFGEDLASYARSSAGAVRSTVKDAVPIEFELRRARDLLDEVIPEMHENIRAIAREEVEIAALEEDIADGRARLDEERGRIARLREMLETDRTGFVLDGQRYERSYVREDMARRLERAQEAEEMLAAKDRLLNKRRESLRGTRQMLDRTRSRKMLLADRIEGLESQHRLVRAASVGSELEGIDDSKIAETEELVAQIKKRLDVAERVLAHESRFTQPIPVNAVNEEDLLERVDEYLSDSSEDDEGVRVTRSGE